MPPQESLAWIRCDVDPIRWGDLDNVDRSSIDAVNCQSKKEVLPDSKALKQTNVSRCNATNNKWQEQRWELMRWHSAAAQCTTHPPPCVACRQQVSRSVMQHHSTADFCSQGRPGWWWAQKKKKSTRIAQHKRTHTKLRVIESQVFESQISSLQRFFSRCCKKCLQLFWGKRGPCLVHTK